MCEDKSLRFIDFSVANLPKVTLKWIHATLNVSKLI